MYKTVLLTVLTLLFASCETLQQLMMQTQGTSIGATTKPSVYSNEAGLKEALTIGITQAVSSLSKENGYYSDLSTKITLPGEAATITDHIKLVPGGEELVKDVVLRLNRAAEDAAKKASPVFVSAIKNMTFSDATAILFGNQTAATTYLKNTTYSTLTAAFKPAISASLDKELVGTVSTNESWSALTAAYNKVAGTPAGALYGLKTVHTDLSAYVTQQALNGLFIKVGEKEAAIRTNPSARITTLLKKVFGQLDTK